MGVSIFQMNNVAEKYFVNLPQCKGKFSIHPTLKSYCATVSRNDTFPYADCGNCKELCHLNSEKCTLTSAAWADTGDILLVLMKNLRIYQIRPVA